VSQYIIRRLLYSVFVVAGCCVLVFVVTQAMGDPARLMLPMGATDAQVTAFRHSMGWDRPMWEQFWSFAQGAIRLDFGQSYSLKDNAMNIVMERFPRTVQLVLASILLAIIVAVPAGVIAALKPQGALDRLITTFSFVGVSLPEYFVMGIFIIVFAVQLGWAKSSGYDGFNMQYFALPAVALALRPVGMIMIIARSAMIDELRKQYVITARAKGLMPRSVIISHVLKNAIIPVITLGGWQMTRMLGGLTTAVEAVAGWPGLGKLALDAIQQHDLPLLQADVFFVALAVTLLNLVIDISYGYADPRIRYD
jgi:peptide/nickel transport system permease protein